MSTESHLRLSLMHVPRVEHFLALAWLMFTGVFAFGVVVSWDQGLPQLLVASDRSKISVLIAILYALGAVHCARRVLYVSAETERTERAALVLEDTPPSEIVLHEGRVRAGRHGPLSRGLLHDYVADVLSSAPGGAPSEERGPRRGTLPEIYASRLKGPHEIGWFLADVVLKLGLLGTIVGFILMLGSVAQTSSLDANTMQKVLQQMSIGMGTALYTTLAGLLSSLLLAVQFQLLERGSDRLLERIVHLCEVRLPGGGA